jgi:hypothetical protein
MVRLSRSGEWQRWWRKGFAVQRNRELPPSTCIMSWSGSSGSGPTISEGSSRLMMAVASTRAFAFEVPPAGVTFNAKTLKEQHNKRW